MVDFHHTKVKKLMLNTDLKYIFKLNTSKATVNHVLSSPLLPTTSTTLLLCLEHHMMVTHLTDYTLAG